MKNYSAEIINLNLANLDVEELEARLELAAACEAACDCNGGSKDTCPQKCGTFSVAPPP